MPLKGTKKVLQRGKDLLSFFRENEMPVVHITTGNNSPDALYLVPDTRGVEIHPEMIPMEGERSLPNTPPTVFCKLI